MRFFDTFVSDTVAGSGNQSACFYKDADEIRTSRVYYRLFRGGKQNYSLLYGNTVDTTYADGSVTRKNRVCDSWRIHSLKVGVCYDVAGTYAAEPESFIDVTIGGKTEAEVLPGALFSTDPISLDVPEEAYLCVEMSFSGGMTPCFPEAIIPGFVKTRTGWERSTAFPYPCMVGCGRKVKARIGFLGDSITEGIGTEENSYTHWNAVAARAIGTDYAWWNLGLGYARAFDAAADGMWLYKARQNDVAVVCLGVNDLYSAQSADDIKRSLDTIVGELKKAGCALILQTVPPFDYGEETVPAWNEVNRYILEELSEKADAVFDVVPLLMGEKPQLAKYGGHPNAEGCRVWGEALAPVIRKVLDER